MGWMEMLALNLGWNFVPSMNDSFENPMPSLLLGPYYGVKAPDSWTTIMWLESLSFHIQAWE